MTIDASPAVVINCFVSRRTEKKKQRKHQLAQLIKVIITLAMLFIVIPELTKFRTTKCLGHLHIVRMPLVIVVLSAGILIVHDYHVH